MTLYIVLGLLVAAIIIFLLVSSLFDRKKRKKVYEQERIKKENEKFANIKVAIVLDFIIGQNDGLLASFVPSVGTLKMSNIRNKARESLVVLEHSEPYAFTKASNTLMVRIFELFKSSNSNVWAKKLSRETNVVKTMSLASYNLRKNDQQVRELINKVKRVYRESPQ